MKRASFQWLTVAVSLCLVAPGVASGAAKGAANKLAHLPQAVQETIHAQIGDGKLDKLTKSTEGGEVVYEVEMTKAGKDRGFTVSAEGELLSMEVFLPETPAAVQKVIKQQMGTGELQGIDRTTDQGQVNYEVTVARDGKTRDFTVSQQGELIELQVFLEELPASVRQAVEKQTGGGKIGDITRTTDEGQATYDFEVTRDDKTRAITLDAAGKMVESQVFLDETPTEVRKTIQSRTEGGKVEEIRKLIDEDEITYQVELTRNGKTLTLTLDAKGAVIEEEEAITLTDAPGPVQKAINTQAAGGKVVGITRTTEEGEVSFEVELAIAGKHKSVRMDAEGKISDQ